MPQVLIRNASNRVLAALKKRAAANRRSLEAEVKNILHDAVAGSTRRTVLAEIDLIRGSTAGKTSIGSTQIIRAQRDA